MVIQIIFLTLQSNQQLSHMATIDLKMSSKKDKITGKSEILLRFHQGKEMDYRIKTGIFILPRHFRYFINRDACKKAGIAVPDKLTSTTKEDALSKGYAIRTSGEVVIADRVITNDIRHEQEEAKRLSELETFIVDSFNKTPKEDVDAGWLERLVNRFHHPSCDVMSTKEIKESKGKSIYSFALEYISKKHFSAGHASGVKVMIRDLARYETFRNKILHEKFKWNIDKITRHDLEDFEDYIRNEKSLSQQYSKQFEQILETYPSELESIHTFTKIQNRGDNTVIKIMKKFRAFMQWLYEAEYTKNRPFEGYTIGSEKYGLPFYLWKEERNTVAEANLRELWSKLTDEEKTLIPEEELPFLSVQRDIFIFQCLVGCRVGDLNRLTSLNITNGILEYVPSKTMDEDAPVKPRIPLNKTAVALVDKYKGLDSKGRLFPFARPDDYNDAIRKVLLICGIKRNVQVRNSLTGETEIKRICDIATTHMARRTFVGAAYKVVRDPNIVGKMSGHVEGSRAFNRYRQIDDEILKETISEI